MNAIAIVGLVLGVLAVVALGLVIGLGPLLRKGKLARRDLEQELQTEPALRGPESGVYRGTTGSTYSKVLGNGRVALTARRIVFVKLTGGRVDVPLDSITDVSTAKTFNRSRVGGNVHLVVHTRHGDVAYFVRDPDGWVAAIRQAAKLH